MNSLASVEQRPAVSIVETYGWLCLAIAVLGALIWGPAPGNLAMLFAAPIAVVLARRGAPPVFVFLFLHLALCAGLLTAIGLGVRPSAILIWLVLPPVLSAFVGGLPLVVASTLLGGATGLAAILFPSSRPSAPSDVLLHVLLLMLCGAVVSAYYASAQGVSLRALEAARSSLRSLIERQPVGTLVVVDNEVRLCNTQAAEILGTRELDLIDRQIPDVLLRSDVEREGLEPGTFEIKVRGRTRLLQMDEREIAFMGAPARMLTITDGTEMRRREESKHQREVRRHQAQRLELIGQVAGGVAHDFNNLLTSILASTELLEWRYGEDLGEDPKKLLSEIKQSSRHAADLVRQLLAYTGRGVVLMETIDVDKVVASTLPLVAGDARTRNVTLVSDQLETGATVEIDPSQFRQVTMNLITNALAACRPGVGKVKVRTRIVHLSKADLSQSLLDLSMAQEGRFVEVAVADNGTGIEPAQLQRIVEPYYTTRDEGSGLGLAAVVGILRENKGALLVDSVPGEGSCFRAMFPLAEDEVSGQLSVPGADDARGLILVVDDEPQVLKVLSAMLERESYQVITADTVEEGFSLFVEHARKIDLVISDFMLPDGTGSELIAQVRQHKPSQSVLVCSAYHTDSGRKLSCYPELRKPFQRRELLQQVRLLVEAGRRPALSSRAVETPAL